MIYRWGSLARCFTYQGSGCISFTDVRQAEAVCFALHLKALSADCCSHITEALLVPLHCYPCLHTPMIVTGVQMQLNFL